jgi:hypothetical protein
MKLILIDGGPASGKNTLGELLVKKLSGLRRKAVLVDLDTYVERYNPKWVWINDEQKEHDQLNARVDFSRDMSRYLNEGIDVVAIGERLLTSEDMKNLTSKVTADCMVYLYHLNVPFTLREKRLHARGPHSLIDLENDQRDRDVIKEWPGYVYANTHSPEDDAENMFSLIQQDKGLIESLKKSEQERVMPRLIK